MLPDRLFCSTVPIVMIQIIRCNPRKVRYALVFIVGLLLAAMCACDNNTSHQRLASAAKSVIPKIKDREHLDAIMASSGEHLIILDFYASWCPPCKELNPILEDIAKHHNDKVQVFKVDIDENKDIANNFRVAGIPHVAFIKNNEQAFSLSGVYPKQMYIGLIDRLYSYDSLKNPG